MLEPITTEATAAAEPTKPKPVRRARQLPDGAIALAAVASNAAKAWQASTLPALLWLKKEDFLAQTIAFAASRDAADAAGDIRSPQSMRLRALDKLLNKGLPFVKAYLAEDHDDEEAYYGEFGIERDNATFRFPRARPERVKSLAKMLAALVKYGFGGKKYGTAYWQPLATEYAQLVQDTTDTSGQRSGKVSEKEQDEIQVRKALQALIHHIKANYPDTFEAQLRVFGFQKEAY